MKRVYAAALVFVLVVVFSPVLLLVLSVVTP